MPEERESEEEDDEKVEIAQRDVPSSVFGGLRKREARDDHDGGDDGESRLRALERINRQGKKSLKFSDSFDCIEFDNSMNLLCTQFAEFFELHS